jgi:PleD family two-component response regulator
MEPSPVAPLILIVLNDAAFRGPLMLALRDRAMRVTLMPDPGDARAFLFANEVALAITEAKLPGIDGVEWIRQRRNEGMAVPIVLCSSTKDEQKALIAAVGDLDVSSIVPKGMAPEVIAAHIDELLMPPPAAQEAAPDAGRIAAAIESMRVSIVNLQKNAESLDRILASITEAKRFRETCASLGAAPAAVAAKQIEDILSEARDGRRRLDGASWVPIDRALQRARDSVSAPAPSASGAEVRRPASSSAVDPRNVGLDPKTATKRGESIDELTGLPTADEFLRETQELLDDAGISGRPLSVCVVGFERSAELRKDGRLNQVMQEIGKFLAKRFRPEDLRGRYAVDAFGLSFPGTPATMAMANMTRTLEALNALGLEVKIGIGIATYPKEGRDAPSTLAIAQHRMELARIGGGVRAH